MKQSYTAMCSHYSTSQPLYETFFLHLNVWRVFEDKWKTNKEQRCETNEQLDNGKDAPVSRIIEHFETSVRQREGTSTRNESKQKEGIKQQRPGKCQISPALVEEVGGQQKPGTASYASRTLLSQFRSHHSYLEIELQTFFLHIL